MTPVFRASSTLENSRVDVWRHQVFCCQGAVKLARGNGPGRVHANVVVLIENETAFGPHEGVKHFRLL